MEVILSPKIPNKYECKYCHYYTSNKKDYNKHLSTAKHQRWSQGSNMEIMEVQKIPTHNCDKCSKFFQTSAGLWKHKSKGNCKEQVLKNDDISPELIKLIAELVKGQNVLHESIVEICKNGTNNNTTTTHTNSHNKAFNLQFFLNETCKDAMNINEFIDSIQLQLSDLEKMEQIGFVEGISNIIIRNLNALDISKRPLHCTDKKRETIYIKDQGVWEKDVENTKIRGLVKKVAGKNSRLLQVFKEKHPDYNQYHSKYSTQYNKLVIEAFGGKGDNDLEKEDKIIRNITKTIVVEK